MWASVGYAPESRIHVLVMRLEPVAEGTPQHACGGARRSAFHDVVLAVEKVGGVAGIKRKALKAGERSEERRRTFPAITKKVTHAECALTCAGCSDRSGIPALKIKIAPPRGGLFITPRILPLTTFTGVGGAVPLRFGGQSLSRPTRICGCFRMAHVHRPVQ